MKLVSEYLERAAQFQRMAASEKNVTTQAQMLEQAEAYYKLAVKRAQDLGQPVPPRTATKPAARSEPTE
jgi:hypothetical protein